MKNQIHSSFQMESLRMTKSTKEGIINSISNSSLEELKKIAPDIDTKVSMKSLIDRAEVILDQSKPYKPVKLDKTDIIAEAIIREYGRPVFFIHNNLPILGGKDIKKFKTLIDNAIKNFFLEKKI